MPQTDHERSTGAMSMLRYCLNPKVLVGLAAVGLVIWWAQPELIRPVLPVLLILACPLSMVLMMRAMHRSELEARRSEHAPSSDATVARDRAELTERLGRAQAEVEVLQGELARLEPDEPAPGDREQPAGASTEESRAPRPD